MRGHFEPVGTGCSFPLNRVYFPRFPQNQAAGFMHIWVNLRKTTLIYRVNGLQALFRPASDRCVLFFCVSDSHVTPPSPGRAKSSRIDVYSFLGAFSANSLPSANSRFCGICGIGSIMNKGASKPTHQLKKPNHAFFNFNYVFGNASSRIYGDRIPSSVQIGENTLIFK